MKTRAGIDNRSVTKSASRVMIGGVFSLFGSLASNVIVAAVFGASADMDAFMTALVVPAYFQIVFFGSLYFVFLPAFIDAESQQGEEDAWALVGTFFWITTIVLLLISVIGSLFSTEIINLIAPGFAPAKAALASRMLSVLFYSTPLIGLGTLTVGVQNARNQFFWPSVAPAFGSFANVLVLLLFSSLIGAMALAWGSLASTVLQAGFTVLPVLLHGWKRMLPLKNEQVRKIGKLMVPLVLFGIIISSTTIIERYFASALPDGQIAYMGYAYKISSIFVVLLASGIAAAIFPSMARIYAEEGLNGLSQKHDFGLQLTFAVALPTIMVVWVMSNPLIGVLFERGAFLHSDTIDVSKIILPVLLTDILFRMLLNIYQRSFYVLKDTITQPLVSSACVIVYLFFAGFFVDRWGYIGLIWAATTRNGLGILTLWLLLFRKFPKNNLRRVFLSILKYLTAALAAYLAGKVLLLVLASTPAIIQLIVGGLLSPALYVLVLYFLEKEMLSSILGLFGILDVFEKLQNRLGWLFAQKTDIGRP